MRTSRIKHSLLAAALAVLAGAAPAAPKDTYAAHCAACHASGVANAPKVGDAAEWRKRLQRAGSAGLIESALKGRGAMPAKGGNAGLGDDDVRATVLFMIGSTAAPAAGRKAAEASEATAPARVAATGRSTYEIACASCHRTGVLNSPKVDDGAAWAARLAAGVAQLHASAINGKGGMPPKGANPNLSDDEVRAATDYMIALVRPRVAAVGKSAPTKAPESAARPRAPRVAAAAESGKGRDVYQSNCSACHAAGVAGAPKLGDASAWSARLKAGTAAMVASALKGKGTMPAKGGNASLADADVQAAVDFMVAQARGGAPAAAASASSRTAPGSAPASAAAALVAAAAPAPSAAATPAPAAAAAAPATVNEVNAFNRLLRPPGRRNLPPAQDGIHDPTNDGTHSLQAPLDAYALLPRSASGNQVDWVKALADKRIAPRADRLDPKADMAVMDLNIVREVKGSMPDVVFPHKQHTEWLDCANCHPAIFVPQKGANQISMASILLGQKCGVCHGRVAFPVSECRMCHARKKSAAVAQAGEGRP